jgi:hypothetical protein
MTHQNDSIDWRCRYTWKRSSKNTLVCLAGCMSGDYAVWFYLHAYHPSMSIFLIMTLAMIAGLTTSVSLETLVLLRQMRFDRALKTAFGMSFFSMIMMELAANIMAYLLSNGARLVWWVILPSLIAGFIAALPYNYYRLKKFGVDCH